MIVTADHGNCEMMVDPITGAPHTAHTTNPVPVILVGGPVGAQLRTGGPSGDFMVDGIVVQGGRRFEQTGSNVSLNIFATAVFYDD